MESENQAGKVNVAVGTAGRDCRSCGQTGLPSDARYCGNCRARVSNSEFGTPGSPQEAAVRDKNALVLMGSGLAVLTTIFITAVAIGVQDARPEVPDVVSNSFAQITEVFEGFQARNPGVVEEEPASGQYESYSDGGDDSSDYWSEYGYQDNEQEQRRFDQLEAQREAQRELLARLRQEQQRQYYTQPHGLSCPTAFSCYNY